MKSRKRSASFLLGYGIGDYGLNIYWNSLSLILVFWYADVVGLDPHDAGIIFAIGALWDAVSDPIVASLAERNKTRFGTYRPFLLFGSVFLGIAFILLFWVPPWSGSALFFHLVLVHIAFRTCYTIVAVPYSALTARITYSSLDRTDLSGVRMGFAFLGLLTISWLWFPLTRFFGGGNESSASGAFVTAAIGAFIATIALLACFTLTREVSVLGGEERQRASFIKNFWQAVTKNKALRILLILISINSASGLSLNIPLAFYIEASGNIFANKEVIFTTNAIAILISVPFWTVTIRALGKKKSWTLASIGLTIFGLHLALFGPLVLSGVPIQVPLMGFCTGAYSILIWAIIPDTVEYGQYNYGERAEGASYGAAMFAQKLSHAMMGFAIGVTLSWVGYDSSADVQSPDVTEKLGIFLGLVPSILMGLSVFIIFSLPINRVSHAKIVSALSNEQP